MQEDLHQLLRGQGGLVLRTRLGEEQPEEESCDLLRRRNPGVRGFNVLKRRWVVERSIGWIMLHRRLARDYETLLASSETMIHVASIDNLTKHITDETTPTRRGTY